LLFALDKSFVPETVKLISEKQQVAAVAVSGVVCWLRIVLRWSLDIQASRHKLLGSTLSQICKSVSGDLSRALVFVPPCFGA